MLPIYRVITQKYDPELVYGFIEFSHYHELLEAYKKCIPIDESKCCRRMFNSVSSEIKNNTLVRVTCDTNAIYWIQVISDISVPLANLPAPKIEHCH